MTRKEQIEKAATDYINSDAVSPMNMQLAFGDFINGAKWADKTMIETACEWMMNFKNAAGEFPLYDYVGNFRKAMEE